MLPRPCSPYRSHVPWEPQVPPVAADPSGLTRTGRAQVPAHQSTAQEYMQATSGVTASACVARSVLVTTPQCSQGRWSEFGSGAEWQAEQSQRHCKNKIKNSYGSEMSKYCNDCLVLFVKDVVKWPSPNQYVTLGRPRARPVPLLACSHDNIALCLRPCTYSRTQLT